MKDRDTYFVNNLSLPLEAFRMGGKCSRVMESSSKWHEFSIALHLERMTLSKSKCPDWALTSLGDFFFFPYSAVLMLGHLEIQVE